MKYFELDKQMTKEINNQLIIEGKTSYPVKCETCNGKGWASHPIHVCGGNEEMCNQRCPEEEQVKCENCDGSGFYDVAISKTEDQLKFNAKE